MDGHIEMACAVAIPSMRSVEKRARTMWALAQTIGPLKPLLAW